MGVGQSVSSGENSTTGAALDSSIWKMEIGADTIVNEGTSGFLVGGVVLTYATDSTDVTSSFGDGAIATTGLGTGLAATWYDYSGFYVDGQVQYASYDSDLTSATALGSLASGNGGTGFALSMEAGKAYQLASGFTFIPQVQLSQSTVSFDDFTTANSTVALTDASSTQLRLGVEFDHHVAQAEGEQRFYGIANLFHEFGAGSEVDVSGVSLTNEGDSWAAGVGVGGSYAWNDQSSLYGEATFATALGAIGETYDLSLNAGLKKQF
jgi:outer membrane autotransporter protein